MDVPKASLFLGTGAQPFTAPASPLGPAFRAPMPQTVAWLDLISCIEQRVEVRDDNGPVLKVKLTL
jgi:hypothetical protein